MALSDDEEDAGPHIDYYFVKYVNDKEVPVAFSELPLQWKENEQLDGNKTPIYLHGKVHDGLRKIFVQVTAWRFNISNVQPEISVLSKDKVWIDIEKPRKIFQSVIRTILITIHCLHYVKKNPETSERYLWEHLSKVFSIWDDMPSRVDLADHTSLIREAVERDETLRKAKFFVSFFDEKLQKKKATSDEDVRNTKPGFIVDDDVMDEVEDDDSDDEEDLFDTVCSFCDNGGTLLCCEGRCLRSFHATVEDGSESKCQSLGLTDEQVEAIQTFVCKNCQYKQHQCFVCGELGSSDKSSGAEVFSCVSATCGHFYHPHCVAKRLHSDNATEAEELQKKIADGESFTCPIHKCLKCKLGEDKTVSDLQFAVCRRCPKSFHRKCLPRKIALEEDKDNGITQRAWEGLLRDRLLIYCLKHEIEEDQTPERNHIQFPEDGCKKTKPAREQYPRKEKVPVKQGSPSLEGASRKRPPEKSQKGVNISSKIKENESSRGNLRHVQKQKVANSSRKHPFSTGTLNVKKSLRDKNMSSSGKRLLDQVNMTLDEESPKDEQKKTMTKKPIAMELDSSVELDADAKDRILALMKDARASITVEHIPAKHSVLSTHVALSRYGLDKTVTAGKVEGAVEAVRAALQKLEKGCSIEDAKAVCEPGLLLQIEKWKNKLQVYLSPFFHGMRYTSFGRHFTKEDKLKEIADRLHYYVQDDDMVVDFCCGSNDFSCLMKKKLDEVGKKCAYKNYDILQAKHDFNFEKRDWMSVQQKELPPGSQLIMGPNPPFGMNCMLANKFIDKALEFKPKLLILIVPRETERLDRKSNPYDLVWEDDELLSGKSFYFPGSVDVNDNQIEDWNNDPPPLSLWSHPDWTAKHKAIARQHGHLSKLQEPHQEDSRKEDLISSINPLEGHDLSLIPEDNHHDRNEVQKHLPEKGSHPSESPKVAPALNNGDRKDHSYQSSRKRKRNRNKGKPERGLEEGYQRGRERGGSRSLEHRPSRTLETPSCLEGSKGKPERGLEEGSQRGMERGRGRSLEHRPSRNFEAKPERGLEEGSQRGRERGGGGGRFLDHRSSRTLEAKPERVQEGSQRGRERGGGRSLDHRSSGTLEAKPERGLEEGSQRGKERDGGRSLDHRSSRTLEAPSCLEVDMEVDPPFDQNLGGSRSNFETGYGGPSGVDDIGGGNYLGDTGPGPRNSVERFAGYERGSTDTLRSGYFFSEIEDMRAVDFAMRSQMQLGGQPEPPVSGVYGHRSGSSSFLGGQEPPMPPPYGHHLGSADTSYGRPNTISTMQRYAPQLDELNHRVNSFRPAESGSRNGMAAPPPGYRTDTLGFAPGPYRSFSQNNSSGWLND